MRNGTKRLMPGLLALAAIALVCVFSLTHLKPASADNPKLDFKLVNKTGETFTGLWISPTKKDDWGDNILDEDFDDGDTLDITFSPKAHTTHWDMQVQYKDEDQKYHYWRGLDLSTITKITLRYDPDTDTTSADIEHPDPDDQ